MKTLPSVLLVLAFTPLLAHAANEDRTYFSAGPAMAWLDSSAGDAELGGFTGTTQLHIGHLLIFDVSVAGSYSYLSSTDSTDLERQNGDADIVLATSLLGIFSPYVTAGVSYDRFDSLAYSKDNDWDSGFAAGLGVEIMIFPKLLSVTPSVRYVDADQTDTVTYALNAEFHFSVLAVGAGVSYEDNLSREGNLTTASLYAALRF